MAIEFEKGVASTKIGEINYQGVKIMVHVGKKREADMIDIRLFFFSDEKDEWFPTKRGIRIPKKKFIELFEVLKQVL